MTNANETTLRMSNGKTVVVGEYGWFQPAEQHRTHGDFTPAEVDEAWTLYSAGTVRSAPRTH